MTYNECELNDDRKELARRREELRKLKLQKAVLVRESDVGRVLKEDGLCFYDSKKLVEIARLTEEVKRLEFYVNNLDAKEKIISKKVEDEAFLKGSKSL